MRILEGFDVKIFTDNIEETALDQLRQLMSISVFKDCKVRIMPDVHAGAGCVIGFTADLGQRVIPNIVGVDIGCGMRVVTLDCTEVDYAKLDEVIRSMVPSGRNIHEDVTYLDKNFHDEYNKSKELINAIGIFRELKDVKRLYKSIGTLGGGNHFIEIDKDEAGTHYLVIHTGSRNLGKQVAEHYQHMAWRNMNGWDKMMEEQKRIIAEYKAAGRRQELQEVIAKLHNDWKASEESTLPKELMYLESEYRDQYIHDMSICQTWAELNRQVIAEGIVRAMGWKKLDEFETIHNYIDIESNIIRKGAVNASKDKVLIIPMNMRDGSLLCKGKGNDDWNQSAPHGAGRLFSRSEAFRTLKMEDFQRSMDGIYTTSVTEDTLDEAPMVYKPMQEIISNIYDTVEILEIIKPTYNFKASEYKFNMNHERT